jgi:hypothetical protein
MFCFTQTYSDNRHELFYFHNKDKVDRLFRNQMDKNVYAFHNVPELYRNEVLHNEYFKMNHLDCVLYNNMTYSNTFYHTLRKCKEEGYTYLFFLQDDVFSIMDESVMKELLQFIKTNRFDMLNLETPYERLTTNAEPIYSSNGFTVYNTTTEDFKKSGLWPFDDSPYVAHIDYLLQWYDYKYIQQPLISYAEAYLAMKANNSPQKRYVTNHVLFKRIGIVGPNAWNREVELGFLQEKFDKNENENQDGE